ncbi:MAG TPA: ATP-binding protein, partial [Actinomycetospora sp.]|nr:ATP-binding protein [Actinomycetospora sp.]
MSALVGAALSGPGGLGLVTGEAGSGKTRLLEEVATRVDAAGARVLRGHAVPGSGAFRPLVEALAPVADPSLAAAERLAPFAPVLARLLPAWAAAPAVAAAAPVPHLVDPVLVLGEALVELLAVLAPGRRTVLLLDDLHWADADTLAVLEYLAGRLPALGVRVLGALRSDERPPPGLGPLLRHREVTVRDLGRLSTEAAARLVGSLLGDAARGDVAAQVVARAEGLPLLLEELSAGAGAALPEAFADAVARRVEE